MEKRIFERLRTWNPWWYENKVSKELIGFRRDLLEKVVGWIEEKEIKVIVGPRRAGKSTLFYQIIDLLKNKGVDLKNVLLINFQDPFLNKYSLEDLYSSYLENINTKGKIYMFLDEAQEHRGWEKWVKAMYDQNRNISFFISGSNSNLLTSDYSYYLSGRAIKFELFPFNIKEILKINNASLRDKYDEIRAKNIMLEYFQYGGFPEVVFKEPPKKSELLSNYLSDVLERDIVKRYNANREKLESLYKWIATNAGKNTSINKLSSSLSLSKETVSNYIRYLKESYLIIEVKFFSPKLKLQETMQKRYYPIDTGLTSMFEQSFRDELSKKLENAVAINLFQKYKELYYFVDDKTRKDVDFVYYDKEKKQWKAAIVTANPSLKREKESYEIALRNKFNPSIITLERMDGSTPLYEFFYYIL